MVNSCPEEIFFLKYHQQHRLVCVLQTCHRFLSRLAITIWCNNGLLGGFFQGDVKGHVVIVVVVSCLRLEDCGPARGPWRHVLHWGESRSCNLPSSPDASCACGSGASRWGTARRPYHLSFSECWWRSLWHLYGFQPVGRTVLLSSWWYQVGTHSRPLWQRVHLRHLRQISDINF